MLLICLLSSLILQSQFTHPAYATIRQVPTTSYPTIQSAIDASKKSDIIQVAAGTYNEHLIVTIAQLTIIGADKATTIIDGQYTGSVINLQAATTTVTGFTIRNGGRYYGITSAFGSQNITGNIIQNNADGIYFSVSDSNIISDNTFYNNSMHAINLSVSIGTQISGNTISDSAYGISLSSANSTTVSRNTVSETSYGIFTTLSTLNTITYNRAMSNSVGIQTAYSDHLTISHNIVSGGMYDIQLQRTHYSQLSNNTITEASYGVYLAYCNYNTFGGTRFNQVSRNDWGITLYNSTHNQIIDGNVIAENTWGLYIIASSSTNTIYRNNFFTNVRQAYQEVGSVNTWDNGTAGNYWNDYGGYPPASGVDYHPLSQPWPMRNIATTSVTKSKTQVFPGEIVSINVTVKNFGVISENFPITAYYNSTAIGNKTTVLALSAVQTITIIWDTTGVQAGEYTISATAGPIPYAETNYSDNSLNGGTVKIGLLGDINGDHTVNASDLILLQQAYGSTGGPPPSPNWNQDADLNYDNIVDAQDLRLLGENYGITV
jgi:nitrous oxidase accessory protein